MDFANPTRVQWTDDFPDVGIHTNVASRDSAPEYREAKSGDADSALVLAKRLICDVVV